MTPSKEHFEQTINQIANQLTSVSDPTLLEIIQRLEEKGSHAYADQDEKNWIGINNICDRILEQLKQFDRKNSPPNSQSVLNEELKREIAACFGDTINTENNFFKYYRISTVEFSRSYAGFDLLAALKLFETPAIPEELGPYRIDKLLGRGAYTEVYLAHDSTSSTEHKVALKFPLQQRLDKESILNERMVWKLLSMNPHPHILNLYGLNKIDNFTFFVTEYMDGGNLALALNGLSNSQRLSKIVEALEKVCKGLAFAHRLGVVHGDIKPENILVSQDLRHVKLGDFGLSFLFEGVNAQEVEQRKVAGTYMFLAPESFDGERTFQTDIYALGVTLYFLLTGDYPFTKHIIADSNIPTALKHKQLRDERLAFTPNLRNKLPGIPQWLEEVVQHCMAPRNEDRFTDAVELLEHIDKRIILTAVCFPDGQAVDYDLEINKKKSLEKLSVEINYETIKGLCLQWEILGQLAILREFCRKKRRSMETVDEQIRDLLRLVREDGAHFMLGRKIRDLLESHLRASLWLFHDPQLTAIPWELFEINGSYLGLHFSMARWPKLKLLRGRTSYLNNEEKIRVLLIANPTGDLAGTADECEAVAAELNKCHFAERLVVEVVDETVDAFTLRAKMRRCHILHYAGHAVFSNVEGDLTKSGWLLKGDIKKPKAGDLLRASALDDFWSERAPLLVFANACVSGKSSPETLRRQVNSDAAMGVAQAFLSAGVGNYIGTVWPVPDNESTIEFARSFYREFFSGQTVSHALLSARKICIEAFGEEDLTWARYVLFGDPHTAISVNQ